MAGNPWSPYIPFLANGNGTMTSLNGFLTGLPDIGLYVNYTMGLQGKASPFGIGETMKRLGYKTVFWYGGLRSWQEIDHFTLREGFDEFHCADELPNQGESSSWGVPDGILLMGFAGRCSRIQRIPSISSSPRATIRLLLMMWMPMDSPGKKLHRNYRRLSPKIRRQSTNWVISGMLIRSWGILSARWNRMIRLFYLQ